MRQLARRTRFPEVRTRLLLMAAGFERLADQVDRWERASAAAAGTAAPSSPCSSATRCPAPSSNPAPTASAPASATAPFIEWGECSLVGRLSTGPNGLWIVSLGYQIGGWSGAAIAVLLWRVGSSEAET